MGHVTDVREENYQQEVLQSQIPVLLDFWAPWCGPCKMILGMLETLAEEYEGRVKICKFNIEDGESISEKFDVGTVPTLKLIKGGEVAFTKIGALTRQQLSQLIADHL